MTAVKRGMPAAFVSMLVLGVAACGGSSDSSDAGSTTVTTMDGQERGGDCQQISSNASTPGSVRTQRSHETQAEPTGWEAEPESTSHQGWRSEGAMLMSKSARLTHAGSDEIEVTLTEWSIDPSAHALSVGTEHFAITNSGTERHELGVVKGERKTLPTKPDGSLDESKFPPNALAGRMVVPAGKTCELDVDLVAGVYTLFCNLNEDMGGGGMHVHYAKGMWAEVAAFGG